MANKKPIKPIDLGAVLDRKKIKKIRTSRDMTQAEFAGLYGLGLASVQNWESGKRQPKGPAKVLLLLIDRLPTTIANYLNGRPRQTSVAKKAARAYLKRKSKKKVRQ